MALREQPSHELISRLRACGIASALATQLVAQFQKWRRDSKDEWTCKHIKDLKVDLIHHMAGQPPVSSWIERRKDGVTPSGPFGALWALSRNPRKRFTALNAMNIYTSLVYDPSSEDVKITPTQAKKFVEAVHRPRPSEAAEKLFGSLLEVCPLEFEGEPPAFRAEPLLDIPIKPYKRSPVPSRGLVPKQQVFPRCLTMLSLAPSFYAKHHILLDSALGSVRDLIPVDNSPGAKAIREGDSIPVILNKMTLNLRLDGFSEAPTDAIVGKVSFIQDSGYKLRHVFVTNELVQIASLPLQSFLMKQLKVQIHDATHNQDAGVEYVQDHLRRGFTAHCFDLTNCSDNLPRSFQIQLFRKLGLDESWVQWFSDICSSLWEIDDRLPPVLPDGKNKKGLDNPLLPSSARYHNPKRVLRMRMRVGQQLGFGPSFPAFALLHHAIVQALFAKLGKPRRYIILGDDIVIFDDEVAKLYLYTMSVFGIPVSMAKSIESNRLAEFAGRVILPDQVICSYKWRGRCSDSNFLDIARNLGPRSLRLLRPRQRFIAEVMGWIPEPFGLGWNPNGLSFSERLKATEELWTLLEMETDVRVRHYQRRTSRLNHMIYDWPEWTRNLSTSLAGDQPDLTVLIRSFPFSPQLIRAVFGGSWEVFLPNLDLLARSPDIGGLNGYEINSLLSRYSWIEKLSKLSQLIIYERKLRLSAKN